MGFSHLYLSTGAMHLRYFIRLLCRDDLCPGGQIEFIDLYVVKHVSFVQGSSLIFVFSRCCSGITVIMDGDAIFIFFILFALRHLMSSEHCRIRGVYKELCFNK